ncbi:hypothetical protein SM124_11585 [Bacillus sp. 31A1R]|uniref:Uncharacterized protein n=2 Tax=Robertmurraya mangrovi TaxID=3098077 RepID=A0ABU5IZ06_9BACI|nr:hypothetical protein [Bacillus sp. 31A1R]
MQRKERLAVEKRFDFEILNYQNDFSGFSTYCMLKPLVLSEIHLHQMVVQEREYSNNDQLIEIYHL